MLSVAALSVRCVMRVCVAPALRKVKLAASLLRVSAAARLYEPKTPTPVIDASRRRVRRESLINQP